MILNEDVICIYKRCIYKEEQDLGFRGADLLHIIKESIEQKSIRIRLVEESKTLFKNFIRNNKRKMEETGILEIECRIYYNGKEVKFNCILE